METYEVTDRYKFYKEYVNTELKEFHTWNTTNDVYIFDNLIFIEVIICDLISKYILPKNIIYIRKEELINTLTELDRLELFTTEWDKKYFIRRFLDILEEIRHNAEYYELFEICANIKNFKDIKIK